MVQQVGAEEEGVKITSELLKSITGEFDLESILFLKLTKIDICNLGCIGDCVNLERLDLSRNDISNLKPLASLKLLTVLNLSANRISNIGFFCRPDLELHSDFRAGMGPALVVSQLAVIRYAKDTA